MFVSDQLSIHENGHLMMEGVDTVAAAARYGTPLYLMSETAIRNACRTYRQSIENYYDGRGLVAYASKAFCCKEICRIMAEEGMGLDVVSGGELYTALAAGFPAERIIFHGNNKTAEELSQALEASVGRIVTDNFFELELLDTLARAAGKTANVLFRVKPGVDAHTHDFVRTGQIDSKFGFALQTGEALAAVEKALSLPNLRVCGLHCHIGSQIFDVDPFAHAARLMIGLMQQIREKTGAVMEELNLGGGFGIRYTEEDDPVPYVAYMQQVSQEVRAACAEYDLPVPFILLEPGRSIVGPAGITLYTVGAVKEIPDIRTYVTVDGGMSDNPRYALYQSRYTAVLAEKADQPADCRVTIAGKCCESGDLLGEDMPLQQPHVGDTLAVLATGAYNYSMASNYNRIPRPPVVMVCGAQSREVVRRETFEDICRCDL